MDDDPGRVTGTDTAERPVVPPRREPLPAWIAWVVVAAMLVVAAVVGARLLLSPADSDPAATDAAPRAGVDAGDDPQDDEPGDDPSSEPSTEPGDPDAIDLTGRFEATVPAEAPANDDVTGELVTFTADNLLDGDPTTCWRMAGDATGQSLTFTFASPVTVTSLGLVNGYAKTSVDSAGSEFDWYAGNRRVLEVEWVLDGATFPQTLTETRDQQDLAIEPTSTTTVELRLVGVSPPGAGATGRDYTALSSVALSGVPS